MRDLLYHTALGVLPLVAISIGLWLGRRQGYLECLTDQIEGKPEPRWLARARERLRAG